MVAKRGLHFIWLSECKEKMNYHSQLFIMFAGQNINLSNIRNTIINLHRGYDFLYQCFVKNISDITKEILFNSK